jgi:Tfp pilus assembly protein PilF
LAEPSSRDATLRQGVELHDRGEFDAAIKVYESLLAETPDDATVLHEIALTYQAKQDYQHCIEFATRAAAKPARAQVGGFYLLASCQDDAGDPEQAVATFKQGLERFPRNVMLNLNYGLTLYRLEQPAEARRVLSLAMEEAPGFASPYRAYALALEQQGYRASAMLMRLRFIMSEPESERAIDAAKLLVDAIAAQANAEKESIEVDASASDAVAIASMEAGLGIASAFSRELLSKESQPVAAATAFVSTLQTFVTMSAQAAEKKNSFVAPWVQVLKPLGMLSEEEVLEAFLYHVGALGRAEGAVKWVNEHPDQMSKLAEAINGYHAKFTQQQMGAP